MSRNRYLELLKDSSWQKKRLSIFNRDNWSCRNCLKSNQDCDGVSFHVHHLYYIAGAKPWEYPEKALATLCSQCHESETRLLKSEEKLIIQMLKQEGFMAQDISLLRCVIEDLSGCFGSPYNTYRGLFRYFKYESIRKLLEVVEDIGLLFEWQLEEQMTEREKEALLKRNAIIEKCTNELICLNDEINAWEVKEDETSRYFKRI